MATTTRCDNLFVGSPSTKDHMKTRYFIYVYLSLNSYNFAGLEIEPHLLHVHFSLKLFITISVYINFAI